MNLIHVLAFAALAEAESSPCERLKVGAVGISEDLNHHYGFNYMKDGTPCEINPQQSKSTVTHAEIAVFEKANGDPIEKLIVTHSPCIQCAKRIVKEGVKYVYYVEDYRSADGLNHLVEHGVMIEKISLGDKR